MPVFWAGRAGRIAAWTPASPHHGWIAWLFAVMVPTLLTLLVHWLLWQVNVLLAFAWSVAVLYVTLGFRQFSHYFTDIRDALDDGDEDTARELLAQWRQVDASELPRSEIVRHVIEYSVLAAHRHVFGVLGWFSVLAALGLGPAGAVLYRMSEFVARYWTYKSRTPGEGASPALQQVANSAWGVIDFVPSRVTSLGFAVVGSFEDAIDAWRNYTQRFPTGAAVATASRNDGLILAATSGAVNVRLGGEALKAVLTPSVAQEFEVGGLDARRCSHHRIHARPRARGGAPAQRRGPGLALGGAVDGAAGAADAGAAARLERWLCPAVVQYRVCDSSSNNSLYKR